MHFRRSGHRVTKRLPRRTAGKVLRWAVALAALSLLAACAGGSDPTPTPTLDPAAIQATATADAARQGAFSQSQTAEAANKPLCLVDPTLQNALRQIGDELQDTGLDFPSGDASRGLEIYQLGLDYAIIADCRQPEASPVASPAAATPVACIGTPESIQRLRDAAAAGMGFAFQLAFAGADEEVLTAFVAVNQLLILRAEELEIACGLRPPASPVASPVAFGTPLSR